MDGPSGEWSLRAELLIRPEGNGVTVVAAEGGVGPAEVRPISGTGGCSVTLTAGPRHTLTLTCTPPPPRIAPPSREVASQTSSSLIPHLLQQLPYIPEVPKEEPKVGALRRLAPEVPKGRKNPRTVHIDVYCTESSGESGGEGATLFESDCSKVVHARKSPTETPHGLRRAQRLLSDCASGGSVGTSGQTSSRWSTSTTSTFSSSATGRSVAQTDSFDYENSRDRLRIAEKEKQWRQWASTSSDSDSDSSGPELAWSFAEADGGGLHRTDTIRRSEPITLAPMDATKHHPVDRLGNAFGPVIRRANRHVGPTKNPNCPCDTCRFHFANALSPS